jgi:protoporphyrinogen oxidase
MRILIIGGGPSGIKCAYDLLQKGQEVTIFEREPVLGGLARSFELCGTKIERYYHFICAGDTELINTAKRLDLRLHWKYTRMGLWREGNLYPFSGIADLLCFTPLSLSERIKYLWAVFLASQRNNWNNLENVPALDWLRQEFGQTGLGVIWQPLMQHKFGSYANNISAAWIWARIKRLASSRTRFLKREQLAYLQGGSESLLTKLTKQVTAMGGRICTGTHVEQIFMKDGHVCGLYADGSTFLGDIIISTVPVPRLALLLPEEVEESYRKYLGRTKYLGVICIVLQITKSLSPYFWINISGNNIPFPGIIEYTNLNPLPGIGGHIIYLPSYLPREHVYFTMEDKLVLNDYLDTLMRMFPYFDRNTITESFISRDLYAQPICQTGFTKTMVSQQSLIQGLYVIDNSQLHPDDRNISQAFGLANSVTQLIENKL